jgi:glycosyltransferase involved in cell wall biosynthesis
LRFGFIGSIMPHKGAHVAVEAIRGIDPAKARLDIWGNPELLPDYASSLTVSSDPELIRLRGSFDDDRKAEVFANMDVLLVPSIGLESFGIVAREAMAAGVPVIASSIGALAELEIDDRCGALVAPGDADALRHWIERLMRQPELLVDWRESLPTVKTVAEHSAEVAAVYEEVLAG